MEIKNGYTVIYNAQERVTEAAPGPVYAHKPATDIAPAVESMLISYDANNNYVNLKEFRIIYAADGHLFGNKTGVISAADTELFIKTADGTLVFGYSAQ